jgi:dimeric dUTPase (all-alpha-NTP-PPase superfamily)
MTTPDRLDQLFILQDELNRRIGIDASQMTDEERQTWLLQYCRALNQEVAELTDCVPWKWWAKYQAFDAQNSRVEIVDLLHFVISLAQVAGMSASDVFAAYSRKHRVNMNRQESGYHAKDESDNKHI